MLVLLALAIAIIRDKDPDPSWAIIGLFELLLEAALIYEILVGN